MSTKQQAEIGILGGTGVYAMEQLQDPHELELATPYGPPSSPVRVGTMGGRRVAFIARHGPGHRYLPHEVPYHANVHALKQLGVTKVLGASAVGSLREELPPRTLVVIDQLLDRTRHRGDTFFGDGLVAHVSLADPFSPALRAALLQGAKDTRHEATDGGTYLCMEGPQFSTRAESVFYKGLGCSVIGMTVLTEARLLREAEIAYASLTMVTDYDAWRTDAEGVEAGDILSVLRDNAHVAGEVLLAALAHIPAGLLPANRALDTALVTPLGQVPAATRARLAPLLARFDMPPEGDVKP